RVTILIAHTNVRLPTDHLIFKHAYVLAQHQNPTPGGQTTGPMFHVLYGRDQIKFSRPPVVGTKIEVTFSSEFMPLVTLSAGTITSAGAVLTGTGTKFTQLLGPDFQGDLPGGSFGLEIEAELIAGGFTQRVKTVTDDTHLTLFTAPPAALAGATYTLATVPDIPSPHHRIISTLATRNIL